MACFLSHDYLQILSSSLDIFQRTFVLFLDINCNVQYFVWLIKFLFSRLWVSASVERFLMSIWQATLFFQMNTSPAPASASAVGKSSHLRNHSTSDFKSVSFLKQHSLRRTYSLLFKSPGAVFECSLLSSPKLFLFKYSTNSNIVKYDYNLKWLFFYYSIF